jgi:hypothetical protein
MTCFSTVGLRPCPAGPRIDMGAEPAFRLPALPDLPIRTVNPFKSLLAAIFSVLLTITPIVGLTGCSASLLDTVLNDLPVAADIAISIVGIAGHGNGAFVSQATQYSGKVCADIKLIESLVTQYKADLAGAPLGVTGQINAALSDAQTNLSAILQAVGVTEPQTVAAVASAVGSIKLILSDVGLLIQKSVPKALSAQLFFGVGVPGVDFMAMVPVDGDGQKTAGPSAIQKPSGKTARQIAREYNQKVGKDFPKATVKMPKAHVLGVPLPF